MDSLYPRREYSPSTHTARVLKLQWTHNDSCPRAMPTKPGEFTVHNIFQQYSPIYQGHTHEEVYSTGEGGIKSKGRCVSSCRAMPKSGGMSISMGANVLMSPPPKWNPEYIYPNRNLSVDTYGTSQPRVEIQWELYNLRCPHFRVSSLRMTFTLYSHRAIQVKANTLLSTTL